MIIHPTALEVGEFLSHIVKTSSLPVEKVIEKKYIKQDANIIGYYSDMNLANFAGITTQVPAVTFITTNAEKSRGRTISIKKRQFRLKKPKTAITSENVKILTALDLLEITKKYSEYSEQETTKITRKFITDLKIEKKEIEKYLIYYPKKVEKLLNNI